jgi:hypothetical protein
MSKHRTRKVLNPFTDMMVSIDVKIVPLLQAIWSLGIETEQCCQNSALSFRLADWPKSWQSGPRIWLNTATEKGMRRFLNAVADNLPDESQLTRADQVYMAMHNPFHKWGWGYRANANNGTQPRQGAYPEPPTGRAEFQFDMSVLFPVRHYPVVLAAVQQAVARQTQRNVDRAVVAKAVDDLTTGAAASEAVKAHDANVEAAQIAAHGIPMGDAKKFIPSVIARDNAELRVHVPRT